MTDGTHEDEELQTVGQSDLSALLVSKILLMHVVEHVFRSCGNSYSNSYTELWLEQAKALGAYHGNTTGNIIKLQNEWYQWLEDNGGLPDLPERN